MRNKLAKINARKRAVKFVGGEFSYKAAFPYWSFSESYYTAEEQLKIHSKYIDEWWVRGLISGKRSGHYNAPKWFRKHIDRPNRHAVKQVLRNMTQDIDNVDDFDIPHFKQHANWDWF